MRFVPHTRIENLRLTGLEKEELFGPHRLKLGPDLCARARIAPPEVVHVRILGANVLFTATVVPGPEHEVVLSGYWARRLGVGQEIHVDALNPVLRTNPEDTEVRILETDGGNNAGRVRLGTVRDLEPPEPPR